MSGRPNDFDVLPRRWRAYVQGLEARVRAADEASAQAAPTRIKARTVARDAELHIDDGMAVEFTPGIRESALVVKLGDRRGMPCIEVSSEHGRLQVLPEVSNVVLLRVEER